MVVIVVDVGVEGESDIDNDYDCHIGTAELSSSLPEVEIEGAVDFDIDNDYDCDIDRAGRHSSRSRATPLLPAA